MSVRVWRNGKWVDRPTIEEGLPEDQYGRPVVTCRLCGEKFGAEKDYHFLGVCWTCGDDVANLYNHAHGGEYLIWPNPRRQPAYKKAPISQGLREDVLVRDNYTCRECGSRRRLTVGHIHPERHGGKATIDNLQTLCRPCNSRKGAKV